ncbi:hypothetical protein FACS1894196_2300 [Clostridia bacterium]|nr:hypothetical protein FACS1894196_2300 [Clostridia bacterium]
MPKKPRKDRQPPAPPPLALESIASFSEATGAAPTPIQDSAAMTGIAALAGHVQNKEPEDGAE